MFRRFSVVAAMLLVLLPIGGMGGTKSDIASAAASIGSFALGTVGGLPEPATVALLCAGLVGVVFRRVMITRRRRVRRA